MAHAAHRVAWARPELDHSTISLGFSAWSSDQRLRQANSSRTAVPIRPA